MSSNQPRVGFPNGMFPRASTAQFFRGLDTEVRKTYPHVRVREIRATFRRCRRLLGNDLTDTDLIGVAITWIIHIDLAREIPTGPLDASLFASLRIQAARITLVSLPEHAQPLAKLVEASSSTAPTSGAECLMSLHHAWFVERFLPCLRPSDKALSIDPRCRWLNHAWLAILAASQHTLSLDPSSIRTSVMELVDPKRNRPNGTALPREYPPDVHESSEYASAFLTMVQKLYCGLDYLSVSKEDGQVILNFRGVRDRVGHKLGVPRSRRTEVLDMTVHDSEKAIEAARQADRARPILDALRDLRDVDASGPGEALVAEIAGRALAESQCLEDDGAASLLRAFLKDAARRADQPLTAAVAHDLFGLAYPREKLAARFNCSARQIQLRGEQAKAIAEGIRRAAS